MEIMGRSQLLNFKKKRKTKKEQKLEIQSSE